MIECRTCRCSFGKLQIGLCGRSTFQRSGDYPVPLDAHVAGCAQTRIDNHYVTPVSNATNDHVNIVEHHFDAGCGLFFRIDGRILGNIWAKQLLAGSVLFVDVAEFVGLP